MTPGDEGLVAAGTIADFPDGVGVPVVLGARRVVIYRTGDSLHAIKDVCPHEGEALHRLPADGGVAVCAGHGWRFDLRTGRCLHGGPGSRVAVYPVVVRGEQVFVKVR